MSYETQIKQLILTAASNIDEIKHLITSDFLILPINSKIQGHYCTNFFFTLKCSSEAKNSFLESLLTNEYITNTEIIKGYLNLTFSSSYFENRIHYILENEIIPNIGNNKKVNVEYCSVNPTGYLHIGHARNAILGDSIAKILDTVGFNVIKEYYVNDAGNQVNLMAESIYARYCELNNIDYLFPENGYKGQEMYDVAKILNDNPSIEDIKPLAVQFFLNAIKKDLNDINIFYDSWVFESKIIEEQYIQKALAILEAKNFIDFDIRSDKKVQKGNISSNKLILLKTTLLGDDQDRPLTKSDGSWTYFAPDIGYHLFKMKRGFEFLVCILGADHDSYAKRIKIATKLMNDSVIHKTPICQMVSFDNDGSLVKFSKRMGNSIRISDFISEIPSDILRFLMLEKSADTQFVFNYENAVNISMKNPLFYCQYAFARACSILRNIEAINKNTNSENNFKSTVDFYEIPSVQEFIITLDSFTQVISDSANDLAPHKLVNYTKKLCENMHKLWQIGKINSEHRIITNNISETNNRKLLIDAFIKVAKKCFYCLGINAPEEME